MELHELHVHQLGAGLIREGLAVPRVFPAVAGDPVGAADPAGREHDRRGAKQVKSAALAVVAERARHATAVGEEPGDRAFHIEGDSTMDAMIL